MENNELIILEQLPIIKCQLEQLSVVIKDKVQKATCLVVNEDTVKEVKQIRAELNKEFNELETQRKQVKQAIMLKYDEFEDIYKENVSNLYKDADATLKEKIDEVENNLRAEKEDELRAFAEEWFISKGIEHIVTFENIGLNITLSASMKSLKDQIIEFCEKVFNDIKLIEMEEYKDEIMFEYKNCLDFAKSKMLVVNRHSAIDTIKAQQEVKQEQIKQEEQIVEQVEEITAPTLVKEEQEELECTFTIRTTKENIIELKNWLKERNIKYE